MTQQDLLERIVTIAFESREQLVESFRDGFEPLSDDEIERLMAGTIDSGSGMVEEEIDYALYDGEIE